MKGGEDMPERINDFTWSFDTLNIFNIEQTAAGKANPNYIISSSVTKATVKDLTDGYSVNIRVITDVGDIECKVEPSKVADGYELTFKNIIFTKRRNHR